METKELMKQLGYKQRDYLKVTELLTMRWDNVIPIKEIAGKIQRIEKEFPRSLCYHIVSELYKKNGDYLHRSEMSWLRGLSCTS